MFLTIKLREIIHEMRVHYLVFQQILLVEEKDDGGVLEPGIGDDGPEKGFALLHTVLPAEKRGSRCHSCNKVGD